MSRPSKEGLRRQDSLGLAAHPPIEGDEVDATRGRSDGTETDSMENRWGRVRVKWRLQKLVSW